MNTRQDGAKWAGKLQDILGSGYEIKYDAGDSGMTFCYYNGELYKQVENSAMRGNVNVYDFTYSNANNDASVDQDVKVTLNGKQQAALNRVIQFAHYGSHEIKELTVDGYDFGNDVHVLLEMGMPNDEGTMAEAFCRDCFSFNIGERGGIFFFNRNRDYAREYIKYYEIQKANIYR